MGFRKARNLRHLQFKNCCFPVNTIHCLHRESTQSQPLLSKLTRVSFYGVTFPHARDYARAQLREVTTLAVLRLQYASSVREVCFTRCRNLDAELVDSVRRMVVVYLVEVHWDGVWEEVAGVVDETET